MRQARVTEWKHALCQDCRQFNHCNPGQFGHYMPRDPVKCFNTDSDRQGGGGWAMGGEGTMWLYWQQVPDRLGAAVPVLVHKFPSTGSLRCCPQAWLLGVTRLAHEQCEITGAKGAEETF